MSIFTNGPEKFLSMNEEEYIDEALSIFDIRTQIERAIELLKAQKKGMPASDYRPKFNTQKAAYSMNEIIDISHFTRSQTLEIRITPIAEFGDKSFRFNNEVYVDGKQIKPRNIEEKLDLIYFDLRVYIENMTDYYKENQKTRGWRGL